MKPIEDIAADAQIPAQYVIPFGRRIAKIDHRLLSELKNRHTGRLIVVTSLETNCIRAIITNVHERGGQGGIEAALAIKGLCDNGKDGFRLLYPDSASAFEKRSLHKSQKESDCHCEERSFATKQSGVRR